MEFIVGIIVGGIPVILEAYDRYWTISKAFSCFRNHGSELDKLDTVLSTQKVLFRGGAIKILSTLTRNPAKAHSLLGGDATWADLSSEPMLQIEVDSVKEAFTSWKGNLDQIHSILRSICTEVETFRSSCPTNPGTDTIKLSRTGFSEKFRLCFRKEGVQRDIRELRDFVSDFTKLTIQIVDQLGDLDINKPSLASLDRRTPAYWNGLERYRQIRAASSSLYDTFALRWSCKEHQQHMAIIALKDDGPRSAKLAEKCNTIRFDAAISTTNPLSSPLWLEIEHIDIAPDKKADVPPNGTQTAEAEPDTSWLNIVEALQTHSQKMVVEAKTERTPNKLKKRTPSFDPGPSKKKTVQFRPMPTLFQETTPLPPGTTDQDVPVVVEAPPLRNLSRIDRFCQHFEANRLMCSSVCIGYLKHTGIYRFYPPTTPREDINARQKSLFEIISEISDDDISRMLPRTATFHLARELASAVLQYHSTPWLPEIWHSSHVQLFGIEEVFRKPESLHLPSPYFRAAFSRKLESGKEPDVDVLLEPSFQHPILQDPINARLSRNQNLFCLGIILLELGYGRTWARLRNSAVAKQPDQTVYHAAMSLSKSRVLVEKMGSQYRLVVEKCLGCDFARGDDLESEALQGAFLVDVVNVLREEERKLVELHLQIHGA